jgi:hypothetical protein
MGKSRKLKAARRAAADPSRLDAVSEKFRQQILEEERVKAELYPLKHTVKPPMPTIEQVKDWGEHEITEFLIDLSISNHDDTDERTVYLLGQKHRHTKNPVIVAIGKRLNRIGGLPLMDKTWKIIIKAESQKRPYWCWSDYRELSTCWHGIGGWLD